MEIFLLQAVTFLHSIGESALQSAFFPLSPDMGQFILFLHIFWHYIFKKKSYKTNLNMLLSCKFISTLCNNK